jgi:hypothetical protein
VPLQNLDQKRTKAASFVRFLKKVGIKLSNSGVAGHDYTKAWPDVVSEVNKLARLWKSQINLSETLWHLKKPDQF